MKSIREYINILENLGQGVTENVNADPGEKVLNYFAKVLAKSMGIDPEEALENIYDENLRTPAGIPYYFFEYDTDTYYMGILPGGKPTALVNASHSGGGYANDIEIAAGGKVRYKISYDEPDGLAELTNTEDKVIAQTEPDQDYQDMIGIALDLIWRGAK